MAVSDFRLHVAAYLGPLGRVHRLDADRFRVFWNDEAVGDFPTVDDALAEVDRRTGVVNASIGDAAKQVMLAIIAPPSTEGPSP